MKLFLLLVLVFPIKLFAMDYYIVTNNSTGLPVIIGSSESPTEHLFKAPKDNLGKQVTTIKDVEIVEVASELCIPNINCVEKAEKICIQTNEDSQESPIPNSRSVIGTINVFCEVAKFSASKRSTRLTNKQAVIDAQKVIDDAFENKLVQIKSGCMNASGLLKLMCEYMSRDK